MLVYGDRVREVAAPAALDEIRRRLAGLDGPGPPIVRHGRLVGLFILAGEFAQALIDVTQARDGGDGPSEQETAAFALLTPLAEALVASWRALGRAEPLPNVDRERVEAALLAVAALPTPPVLRLKTGEGYAYYALYPEAYAEAAEILPVAPEATVIGLRSIGTGLAAVAAASTGASVVATLRPVGHPFRREVALTPAGAARLRARAHGPAVIVDEGPGLSGSSFGAAADALEAVGFEPASLAFLPGHDGELGPEASERRRTLWSTSRRAAVNFGTLLLNTKQPGHRLPSWFADLTGGAAAIRDISGGGWRALSAAEADWPAVNTFQERRKFLLEGPDGIMRLKFAGLGAHGERAFEASGRLGDAGFGVAPAALRHGFVARPWIEAAPLRRTPERRGDFVRRLGRYLGWRAAHLPAPAAGAGLPDLLEMTRVNAAEALGPAILSASALDPALWDRAPSPRPVWTDNRLQAREWLETADGRWLKTDAVDHALAHDLVGPQDVAWDAAGAIVEFGLDAAERALLLEQIGEAARIEPALVDLLEPAYAAFHHGVCVLAAAAHGGWPQERERLQREADRYRALLAQRLSPDVR